METTITSLPWVEIIAEASKSPLGIAALLTLAMSVVTTLLFWKEEKPVYRLVALSLLVAGLLIGTSPITKAYNTEVERLKEIERLSALKSECVANAKDETGYCRATDKSGFHSSPSARCSIQLNAGEGRFFADNQVTVMEEHYRNISGAPARDAMKPTLIRLGEFEVPTNFGGTIGCTNAAGTGRTCEVRAVVRARSFPKNCIEIRRDLMR